MTDPVFPLRADLTALDPDTVKWRIAGTWPKNAPTEGELVPYVDARVVMARLDKIDPRWETTLSPTPDGKGLLRGLTLHDEHGSPVTRWDAGAVSSIEPVKGAASDSLKRCAFLFGIFRELYDIPKIVVKVNDKKRATGGNPRYVDGQWKLPRGGRFRDETPAAAASSEARAPAREEPPEDPNVERDRRRRRTRAAKIRDLIDEVDALGGREVNRFSIRAHVRRVYEVDNVDALFATGTIEQLDELGIYVAGKLDEARHAKEREVAGSQADAEDVSQDPPRRAEEMTEAEAFAAGAALVAPKRGTR